MANHMYDMPSHARSNGTHWADVQHCGGVFDDYVNFCAQNSEGECSESTQFDFDVEDFPTDGAVGAPSLGSGYAPRQMFDAPGSLTQTKTTFTKGTLRPTLLQSPPVEPATKVTARPNSLKSFRARTFDTFEFPCPPRASPFHAMLDDSRGRTRAGAPRPGASRARTMSGVRKPMQHTRSSPSVSMSTQYRPRQDWRSLFSDSIESTASTPKLTDQWTTAHSLASSPFPSFQGTAEHSLPYVRHTSYDPSQMSFYTPTHDFSPPMRHQYSHSTDASLYMGHDIPVISTEYPWDFDQAGPLYTAVRSPPLDARPLPAWPPVTPTMYHTPLPSTGTDFTFTPTFSSPSETAISPSPMPTPGPMHPSPRRTPRRRRVTSSEASSPPGDPFVNFTPSDAGALLSGVAPSGSSKTRARRDREASDARQRLSQAAVRAVREGDVGALREMGIDIGEDREDDGGV